MIVLNSWIGRIAVRKSDIRAVMEDEEFSIVRLDDGKEIKLMDGFCEVVDEINQKEAAK